MIISAAGSKISHNGVALSFAGGTSASVKKIFQAQVERNPYHRHNRIINVQLAVCATKPKWLDKDLLQMDQSSFEAIKLSIASPNSIRPEWVKSGKDFVKWMKMRKEANFRGGES